MPRINKIQTYNEAEFGNVLEEQELKKEKVELQGEFQKIKPSAFDREAEEMVEAWIINMNKYFQVYEYNNKLKARLAIYQLWEKAMLWWEEVKNVRGVEDHNVTWDEFQQYFKDKYLTEFFYDLKLGQMIMDEFITKFTSLLIYVPYLHDEKAKVKHFLSSFPIHMKERIEFVNPKNMDEVIRKAQMCYQPSKAKGEMGKSWLPQKV